MATLVKLRALSDHTRLATAALIATLLICGVARAQPGQPTKYATIEARGGWVSFSPDGERLHFGGLKRIESWDVKTKKPLDQVYKTENFWMDMAYSPDGKSLVVAEFYSVRRIDVRTGDQTLLYEHDDKGERDIVRCVRYSRDGKRIVSGGLMYGTIKVWDVAKREVTTIRIPNGGVHDVVLLPGTDRALIFVSQEPGVLLADLKAGTVKPVADPEPLLYASALWGKDVSADGKLLGHPGPSEGRVRVVATDTLKTELDVECPFDPFMCRFAASGRLLVVGGTKVMGLFDPPKPGEVAILDRATKKWVSHFTALDREVSSMAYSPKHNLLAVASTKLETITVWDLSPLIEKLPKEKKGDSPDKWRP